MSANDFSALRVLVVDDEVFIRRLILRMLRSLGVTDIREAHDGSEALHILKAGYEADIALCDCQMLPMDGLSLLQHLRQSSVAARRELPVVMLTAAADMNTVKAAVKLGINGYLVKPVSPKMLADRLTPILARCQGRQPAEVLADTAASGAAASGAAASGDPDTAEA